ncbi:hypothetical protein ACKLTP_17895, partial [Paenarthrobacter ureafaciens]|uniref:hypothetical protein n=1 Tax=Paenarthrobacter ureafaciens TaxID=37931 RepID=UPI0039797F39
SYATLIGKELMDNPQAVAERWQENNSGHVLALRDKPCGGAGDCPLPAFGHGAHVGVDVSGQVEQVRRWHGGAGSADESYGHISIFPDSSDSPYYAL